MKQRATIIFLLLAQISLGAIFEVNFSTNQINNLLNQDEVVGTGQIYGTVTDTISGDSLFGVSVTTGGNTTQTDTNGYYELTMDEDTYDLLFSFLGYESVVTSIVVASGSVSEESISMYVVPNPVPWVIAEVNAAETECLVTWSKPQGNYMVLYDDDEVDDHLIWTIPGNAVGVRFSPKGYPATVTGGSLNVGDGSFPAGANFIDTQFAVGVIDDDGVNGLPGTVLDSVLVDVVNYNWIDLYDVFDITFDEGDFYIVMWQLGGETNSAPIAIDTDLTSFYNSVNLQQGAGWTESPDQNFMIRAYVNGVYYINNLPDYEYYSHYTIARVSDFDPLVGPQSGTLTPIANTTGEIFNDDFFGGLPDGFHAYAVKVVYPHAVSPGIYSNVVTLGIDNTVTITLTHCMDDLPEGIEVTLLGTEYPFESFFAISDTSGVVVFNDVVDGIYYLKAYKPGFEVYEHFDLQIYDDLYYDIVLTGLRLPPQNLVVDPLTSVATWDDPTIIKLPTEDFEGALFPPTGWQSSSLGIGWYASDNGSSANWIIPHGDGYYALSNDDDAGAANDGSSDYLITPLLYLSDCISYQIKFDYFFDGSNGQSAFLEYSLDTGTTWILIDSLVSVSEWTLDSVDLAFLSGPGSVPVLLSFHADDKGGWASGLAIDNVEVINFPLSLIGYYVYLDGSFITQIPPTIRTYTYVDLSFGQTYEASVRTLRECGLSDPGNYFIWESTYLHPPHNLTDNYVYGTDTIPLMWNPPLTGTIPMAAAFKIVYCGPQTKNYGPTTDAAKEITIIEFEDKISRYIGIQQFSFPDLIATGEAGCETDGEFIYTVLPDGFVKYDIDGNLIEQFSIPGVSGIKDLAYDGEFFYGAAANPIVFVMDFNTHTLVTTFTAPTDIRAIAYNDDDNTFYGNNWGTDIVNFDVAGSNLGSFTPSVSAIYGLAIDKWTIQGIKCLWAYDQGEDKVIQFALPGVEPTGFVVNPGCCTGLAGGLFTHPGLYEEGIVTIGGNAQDDRVWGVALTDYNTAVGLIPDGLTSFNVYQDGVIVSNIPYQNELPDEWITYITDPLSPDSYFFCVSAIYDLTSFGFPGDFGESQYNCADTVNMVWGSIIPYFEGWNSGTFEGWTLNENPANWLINTDEGEPAPSAQFSWEPLLENDYSSTLTSEPIIVDFSSEGDLFLDFELKLEDRNSTGDEKLLVEIYNGATWNQVAEFANNGKTVFSTNHININNHITGNTFNIRFNVTGQNSHDIESWYVDNISVTRQCSSPTNLTGEYVWNAIDELGVELCWEAPDTTSKNLGGFYNNETTIEFSKNSRAIDGFNIYKMEMDSSNYVLYDVVPLQQGQTSYCYFDAFPNVVAQSGYYYQVTANYLSDTDTCESDPAMALEIPLNDFVFVYVTGIAPPDIISNVSIYPNPAHDILNVNSTTPITSLTITNYIGQSVYGNNNINDTRVSIVTSAYPTGVYLVNVKTENNNLTKKVIIRNY